jgi:hypothetical protein
MVRARKSRNRSGAGAMPARWLLSNGESGGRGACTTLAKKLSRENKILNVCTADKRRFNSDSVSVFICVYLWLSEPQKTGRVLENWMRALEWRASGYKNSVVYGSGCGSP